MVGLDPVYQFHYIKIQPKTIDLSSRLRGITTEFVGFIPRGLVLRSIVLCWILIYGNWYPNLHLPVRNRVYSISRHWPDSTKIMVTFKSSDSNWKEVLQIVYWAFEAYQVSKLNFLRASHNWNAGQITVTRKISQQFWANLGMVEPWVLRLDFF